MYMEKDGCMLCKAAKYTAVGLAMLTAVGTALPPTYVENEPAYQQVEMVEVMDRPAYEVQIPGSKAPKEDVEQSSSLYDMTAGLWGEVEDYAQSVMDGAKGLIMELMITESRSRYDTVEETVEAIKAGVNAYNANHAHEKDEVGTWKVLNTMDMKQKLSKHYPDMDETTLVNLCNPTMAHRMLEDEDRRQVSTLMPCAIGVYEKADGIYVSGFNMDMMSKVMPGELGDILDTVAEADHEILQDVIE